MKLTLGLLAGIALTIAARAYAPAFLWWAATRDVRHTDPHLYGWGRG